MTRGGTSRRHRPAVSTVERAQTWCRSSSDLLWVKQPHTDKLGMKTQASITHVRSFFACILHIYMHLYMRMEEKINKKKKIIERRRIRKMKE